MNQSGLHTLDYIVFAFYLIIIALYGYWIYKKKTNKSDTASGFFLAEGSLTFWAIGASLIASNISAEHFIGMSGSGFAIGLAISSYEWMAAAALIVVAIFFLPVYLKNHIYTMPQFLRISKIFILRIIRFRCNQERPLQIFGAFPPLIPGRQAATFHSACAKSNSVIRLLPSHAAACATPASCCARDPAPVISSNRMPGCAGSVK